jgi:hypothetical protein
MVASSNPACFFSPPKKQQQLIFSFSNRASTAAPVSFCSLLLIYQQELAIATSNPLSLCSLSSTRDASTLAIHRLLPDLFPPNQPQHQHLPLLLFSFPIAAINRQEQTINIASS